MEIQNYIYVLNAENGSITAALSCPDKETTRRVYQNVFREMKVDHKGVFRFGHTADAVVDNDFEVAVKGATPKLIVEFLSLPTQYHPKGAMTNRTFDVGEFEEVVKRTEKYLSVPRYRQRDIQIMRCVKLAMTGSSTVSETENVTNFEPMIEVKTEGKKTGGKGEEFEIRLMQAVQYAHKHPAASLNDVQNKFGLGQKALSRGRGKELMAIINKGRDVVCNKGKKTYHGKNEKISKSVSGRTPDYRRSHEDEVDERLDGTYEM